MALYLFYLLSVSFTLIFCSSSSQNGILAKSDWEESPFLYAADSYLSHDLRPELKLLESGDDHRQRRYVPGTGPLEEYLHPHDKLLTSNINIRQPVQTVKAKDNTMNQSVIPDSPASETTTTQATTSVTTPDSKTNLKPSIISAGFYNDNTPRTSEDDLVLDSNTDELINKTMEQNKLQKKEEDFHVYYNSTFLIDYKVGQTYWVNMDNRDDVVTNQMLSKSHRRAATVKLTFDFPFYGHLVRNVTIATGGFLYTGDYVHSWLAATQYIAPLMANFDTSLSNESYIKYADNGTAFTVQWHKVMLQDKPTFGEFTFQTTLYDNGNIVFVYQNVPVIIENIQDDHHPVKVGLSDAYIIDRTIFYVRRKTIYEYHRVNFKKEDIKNWTVIYLKALPTCMSEKDCYSCVTADIGFECKWCFASDAEGLGLGRCSSGMDRHRQDWLMKCDKKHTSEESMCQEDSQSAAIHLPSASAASSSSNEEEHQPTRRSGGFSYLGVTFFLVLIAGVAVWAMYAYSNPHTTSGQILIRYRPSQWSWRRREAGYTAATIHM